MLCFALIALKSLSLCDLSSLLCVPTTHREGWCSCSSGVALNNSLIFFSLCNSIYSIYPKMNKMMKLVYFLFLPTALSQRSLHPFKPLLTDISFKYLLIPAIKNEDTCVLILLFPSFPLPSLLSDTITLLLGLVMLTSGYITTLPQFYPSQSPR